MVDTDHGQGRLVLVVWDIYGHGGVREGRVDAVYWDGI